MFNSDGRANPNSALTPGLTYSWSVTVLDANFNTATQVVSYTVPGGAAPPTIVKSFFPTTIGLNAFSTMVFNITNPNSSTSLSGIGFTDNLPSGMQVAPNSEFIRSSCGGTPAATAGSTSVSLTGGSLGTGAGAACTITLSVTQTITGTLNNTTGPISSSPGGTGATSNTASLTVPASGVAPPVISMSLSPNTIKVGGTSTMSFNVYNPNAVTSTGIAFNDTLTGGLQVAATPSLTNSCGGVVSGATAGSTSVSLSGGSAAAGATCTITIQVTSNTPGTISNTTTAISSTNGGTGATSNTASLVVVASPPTLTSLSSQSGSVGSSITINGTNFGPAQSQVGGSVTFNGVTVTTITNWSSGSITVAVPTGATGTGNVVVTVLGVQTATSSASAFTVTTGVASVMVSVPGPIFASGNAENANITVTNDQAGDILVPTMTLNGAACTTATCGILAPAPNLVSLTGGTGTYTLTYTPPTSANLTTTTTFTLVVSSSLSGSFASTANVTVNPAGAIFIQAGGPAQRVVPNGPPTVNQVVTVYNDVGSAGATISLRGSGYACPSNWIWRLTICGTLVDWLRQCRTGTTSTASTGIPFTRYPITYTPPTSISAAPYDRPMILAVSNVDPTKVAAFPLYCLISSASVTSLVIPE